MDSFAISLPLFPFTNVAVSLDSHPLSVSMFHAIRPASVVDLSIIPEICPRSFRSAVNELPVVYVTIRQQFVTESKFRIIMPLTLVNPAGHVHHYTWLSVRACVSVR